MKKIILLTLMFFTSFIGFAQLPTLESFDNGIPSNWAVFDNGVGTTQNWGVTSVPGNVYSAPNSAEVLRENIGDGNTSEEWMVTSLQALPPNAQFRFYTRSALTGDNGTLYQIRVSSTSQTDMSTFTTVQTYTELELANPANVYVEKVVSLAAYANTNKYIAFVKVHTQIGSGTTGDKWLVDNVSIVEQCPNPTVLTATNITADSAVLGWTSSSTQFDVQYGTSGFELGTGTIVTGVTNPYPATGLTPSTAYQFYVKAYCAGGTTFSEWTGPFNFTTKNLGSVCDDPIVIPALPYQVAADNTGNYGDDIDVAQGTSCGATPAGTNYLEGDEVFYTYTSVAGGPISITMTPLGSTSTNSSLFVYNNCAGIGTSCIAGIANSGITPRVLNMTLTPGQSIVIVISSSSSTQTIAYSLVIQDEMCAPKPTNLTAGGFTLTSADLSWTSTFTTAQVAVQTLGSSIPSGAGVPVTGTTYTDNTLTAATQYQYWVRGECSPGSGTFTAWAGPYPFNTTVCNAVDQCNYTFRMTDSANNGWNGAKMEVRQNGIVIATIGSTYTSGAGPVDVVVPLCNGVPFDLYWSVAGTQPQQCIVAVINSFGQTIYTKPAGTSGVGEIVYANPSANCITPQCDLAPTNVTATNIANYSATIGWTAPATTAWDVYFVPVNTPPPLPSTTPTYANVTTNPLDVSGLIADNTYCVYVRVVCSPFPSPWSAAYCFTTLPTCPKPTTLTVPAASITTTSAVVTWANGVPTDSEWEILLVKGVASNNYETPPPPAVVPVLLPGDILYAPVNTASPYTALGLTPATIYYYYIRTVCSATDKSTWAGPIKFNTVTCDAADKCNYKFVMTDTGNNGWQGGRMQIMQNGIPIQTIGSTITGAGPTTVTVPICNNVPFELVWTVPGTAPEEIGLTVQNPFTDVIYTMVPGSITPPTGTPVVPVPVYNSVGNCTPPTCPKPTALLVNTTATTQTSAELTWTPGGTETQWQVYVVPFVGAVPPVNGAPSPTLDVPPYYLVAGPSPTFTVSGLLPGTTYIYYVRAICSATDVSTWTILNPKTFTTKPVNDECSAAIPVPVNPTKVCTVSVAGNTLGATLSPVDASCVGNEDDDIWFSFVATNSVQIITLSNIVGGTTDLNHTLYSGDDCATMTQLYCSNPNVSVAANLVVGNTYKIRVYTNGAVATQTATFDICITTPPPVMNDECATAITAAVNIGLQCNVVTPGSVTGATASADTSTCTGTEDDDVWFKFVANDTTQYFSLINITGTASNPLNFSVYSGDCGNLTLKFCSPANSSGANNATFVVGQTYYVRVWSNSNVLQDIDFDLCIGRILPPITTSVTQYTTQQLVEDVLLNSTCASVTNITSSTGTNFGSVNGIGSFEGTVSDFPFTDGVILSSGNVLHAPGPNLSILSEGLYGTWTGDADLEAIILAGTGQPMASMNASILEFDFIPLKDQISFNFLFASEEYGQYQCDYSDSFAFILTDLTVSGPPQNLAILPDGTPVSVVTIRDQAFNANCPSLNPEYFATYYGAPFPPGVNPLGAPINYNGLTVPLIATSTVVAGHQYHIKMVVADRGDNQYDSAVFLKGGSFDVGNVDLGSDIVGDDKLCPGSVMAIDSQLDPDDYTITWTKDGVVLPETGPVLNVTETGTYCINAQFGASSCFASDCITIEFYPIEPAGTPNNLYVCNASGFGTFDLTQNTPVILAPFAEGTHTVGYFTTLDNANDNIDEIVAPLVTAFPNTVNPQTIYARVTNTETTCHEIVTFQLIVQDLTPQFTLQGSMAICPEGTTTITVIPTNNNFDPALVTYSWTFEGNPLAATGSSITVNGSAGYGAYGVTVNNSGCTATQTFNITNSNTEWIVTLTADPEVLCPEQSGTLTANVTNNTDGSPVSYTFTLPDLSTVVTENNFITINEIGEYSVTVDILGCVSSPVSLIVEESTATLSLAFESGCNNNVYQIIVQPANNGTFPEGVTYEWSGPGVNPATATQPTLNITSSGTYTVTVTTVEGCKTVESFTTPTEISCTIQKGISPDNDGKNDYFDLSTLNVKHLSIYNRYGVKVYSLANYTNQWYGTTDDGKELPDGTYYYVIERDNVESVTGWIYVIHQNK